MAACSEGIHCGHYFDTALAISHSHCYDKDTSEAEAIEKISADEKDDHKYSLCIIVCIATKYQ